MRALEEDPIELRLLCPRRRLTKITTPITASRVTTVPATAPVTALICDAFLGDEYTVVALAFIVRTAL
jgi:hypothetical protein